jgi:hypothetical protein
MVDLLVFINGPERIIREIRPSRQLFRTERAVATPYVLRSPRDSRSHVGPRRFGEWISVFSPFDEDFAAHARIGAKCVRIVPFSARADESGKPEDFTFAQLEGYVF